MNDKPDPIIEQSTRIISKLASNNKSVSFVQISVAFRSSIITFLNDGIPEEVIISMINKNIEDRLKRCLIDA